jgi:hypothetical protein
MIRTGNDDAAQLVFVSPFSKPFAAKTCVPMCGRFTLRTTTQEVAKTFGRLEVPDFRLRYNVVPTQQVLTITLIGEAGG